MLLGEYEHTIDDKNRLTLPARFRQAFDDGVVLARGIERCLSAYPRSEWAATVESRLQELDPLSREGRVMQRFFFSGAAEAELDKQGRVMIPSSLAEHAGLGKEVVVAGIRDHLEIWDRAAWREHLHEIEGSAEDVAERLATRRD
ncbi:MAG TPA: division/cell wall cluster transcriptional repressor MraZ [Gaiellaceae bacterium]|jgi:MraZ protein|nr:division/cell wall cluster transcriptional repressor MraZ [Gaiellaceae bacterium]